MKKLLLLVFGLLMTTQMIFAQVPSYVPTNGLVGYWPFNGNANDQSGNGNNGTVNGATLTTDRNGNTNNAYSFNGVNNLIKVNHSSSFNTFPMSISLWCKGNSQYGALISKYTSCSSDNGWQLHTMEGKVSTYSYNFLGGAYLNCDGDSNTIITDNNWYNIVSTYDLSGVKIYVNNVLVLTKPYIGNGSMSAPTNIQDVYIGKEINSISCSPNNTFYQGIIDDIGIWNRALTPQEITAMYNGVNYNSTCNIIGGTLVNGLVGYWPFCGNAIDESGNGNNGTVNGATLTTDRFGNADKAYSFNGVNNYINCGTTASLLNPSIFSYSVWINNTDNVSPIYKVVISNYNNTLQRGNILFSLGSDIGDFRIHNGGNLQKDAYSNISVNSSSWYHIVAIKDNLTIKIYVNNVLSQVTDISSFNYLNNTISPFTIGKAGWGDVNYFQGKIDDIGFWDRALTPQEITNLYTNNLSANSFESPKELITIYPNPTNSKINIDCSLQSSLIGSQVTITTILGQEIYNSKINQLVTEIPISSFASNGVYFVQIINAQGQIVDIKKIILQ